MSSPNRSPDFRYLFCNTFGLQVNNNEVSVRLGYSEDAAKPDDSILEHVGIILTPTGAKLLAVMLTETLANFERDSGMAIPVDEERIALLKEQIAQNTKPGPAAHKRR